MNTNVLADAPLPDPRGTDPLSTDPQRADPKDPIHLQKVRYLFESYCGLCHLPEARDDRSPEEALDIFDLNETIFTSALSDARLVEGRRRFAEQNIDPKEMAEVDAWLAAEWKYRDADIETYPYSFRTLPANDAIVTPPGGCLGESCLVNVPVNP